MRFALIVLLAGAFLVSGAPEATFAQDRPAVARPKKVKKPSAKGNSSSSKAKTASSSQSGASGGQEAAEATPGSAVNIGKILPKGRILQGVKLPSYSGDRLSSVMTAVTMERLDEKHLGMRDLRITMYAKPGEKNTLISSDEGIYDLERREITSETRTRIEQGGVFDLEGDRMVFDANTQKGHMTGNVEMLIYEVEETLMPGDKEAEKKEEKREGEGQ